MVVFRLRHLRAAAVERARGARDVATILAVIIIGGPVIAWHQYRERARARRGWPTR